MNTPMNMPANMPMSGQQGDREERQSGLGDYLAAFGRRRKTAIATAAVCIVATLSFALFLPPYYQSSGTILIEQQEVPLDLVRSTVSSYADQRLQVIGQRVMTTQNLLDIIHRYDLYPRERRHETREELMERMRKDVSLKMISADVIDPRSGTPRQATIAFTVSYTSPSREQAVRVANELTTLYLNENLTERARLAEDATRFLHGEGDRLNTLIGGVEGKLAEFKSKNGDSLPELQTLNLQMLDRAQQELRETEGRLMSLDQQRVFLEAQLAQIKPNAMLTTDSGERILSPTDRLKMLKSQLASARALYAPDHPDIVRLEREVGGLRAATGAQPDTHEMQRELESARGQLEQARQKYSADHPDVQRLERRVTGLQSALKAEPPASDGASSAPAPDAPDNPAYIQLQAQLSATRNDQSGFKAQMQQLRAQIAGYERKVANSPRIEKEYRELTRDYESAHLKYQEVRSKQMEAQLAQNLESDRKGERFTLIEPPLPPEGPVSPNRPAILALGFILALGVTFAAVVVLEMLDTRVRGRRDLENLLAAAPLAVLPWIETSVDRARHGRRLRYALAATAASIAVSIVLIHFFYRPLDVVWLAAARRLTGS